LSVLKRNQGVGKRRNYSDVGTTIDKTTIENAIAYAKEYYRSKGYRDRTINDYQKYWADFFNHVPEIGNVSEVTEHDIRRYINKLLEKGLSPVTVNIRTSALRSVFRCLTEKEIIDKNPATNIHKLKVDEKPIFTLTDSQIRRLFAEIDKSSFAGFRDYIAMLLMLKCGLRINEINSLEVKDIDFDNRVILLPGAKNKNRKTRTIPISKKIVDEFKQYVKEAKEYFGELDRVFVNQYGESLREDRIRKRMDKYSRQAGLKDECRASPHSLRHTFATNFLKNGGNIRSLMQILGHSDLETTQIYLNFTDIEVKDQYDKVDTLDILNV
jgi:site-specific recombinase XerD